MDATRRHDPSRMTLAEAAIHEAIKAVERVGSDVRLSSAIVLLAQAKHKLSDFVDGVERGETLF